MTASQRFQSSFHRLLWFAEALAVFGLLMIATQISEFLAHFLHVVPAWTPELLDGALAACIATSVYFYLRQREERRARREQRMEIVQLMNHHVRNALQVMTFCAHSSQSRAERMMIRTACDRVEWSLATVLPMCTEDDVTEEPTDDLAWRQFLPRESQALSRPSGDWVSLRG